MGSDLFGVSLTLSLISLAISLITLFFNFFNKRKPQIYLPTRIFIEKDINLNLVIRMLITFVNKGSRLIVIRNLELDIPDKNKIWRFLLFAQTDKMELMTNLEKEAQERLVSPFEVKKYSSRTQFLSFSLKQYENIFENPDKYYVRFTILYDNDKNKIFYWKLNITKRNIERLYKNRMTVIMNSSFRKLIIPLNKLEKKEFKRAEKKIAKNIIKNQ